MRKQPAQWWGLGLGFLCLGLGQQRAEDSHSGSAFAFLFGSGSASFLLSQLSALLTFRATDTDTIQARVSRLGANRKYNREVDDARMGLRFESG